MNINVIGCGLSGATVARVLAEHGFNITIYERNDFIGGNCHDFYNDKNILIHKYGPHIFHTCNVEIYNFLSRFCKLNCFINKVNVNLNGTFFPLPINFRSIEVLFPKKADLIKNRLKTIFNGKDVITINDLRTANDSDLAEFVDYIYKNVYSNYTAKMWGIDIKDIDPNVLSRVKICLNYETSYFPEDKFQGLPEEGYTKMIKNMISHRNIKLVSCHNCSVKIVDGKINIDGIESTNPIFYCGLVEELFDYKYGQLPYRSLNIEFETINTNSFQKGAVINYPSHPSMTRITEYKKMTLQSDVVDFTTISKEFPGKYDKNHKLFSTPFYPINNLNTKNIYDMYINDLNGINDFYLLGRLSQYKYYDMDDAIEAAMEVAKSFIKKTQLCRKV